MKLRYTADKSFTVLTYLSVLFMVAMLGIILIPMIKVGAGAVFFDGTVEFRKMQLEYFEHGDPESLAGEIAEVQPFRDHIYSMIDEFRKGIDVEALSNEVREIHREFGKQLRYLDVSHDEYSELRSWSRDMRDLLEEAFKSFDRDRIGTLLEQVLSFASDPRIKDTVAEKYFDLARSFKASAAQVDFTRLETYQASLRELDDLLVKLFGPRPQDPRPVLVMNQFGATRWDEAQKILDRILTREVWKSQGPGLANEKVRVPRAQDFEGTVIYPLFDYLRDNVDKALHPRFTIYWRYFTDDSTHGHYFGGVGPEIFGTLLLTVVGMVFVIPVGIITAAYLVECTRDNWVVRIIRMCINSLAGVPSIVFGLFGLAFFVTSLFPALGLPGKPCVLTASLTLAILTLPVMIRASEEAIRAVPQTYKEASLGLGAGQFRTFVKVILPAALPGILTGIILSLSRIAGETAPILFTGAVAMGSIPKSLFDPTRTLSYGSWHMAVGDRLAPQVPHNQYGMVVTLIVLILLLNAISIVLRSRLFKKLKGT